MALGIEGKGLFFGRNKIKPLGIRSERFGMTHYFRIVAKDIKENDKDLISGLCFEFGAAGVSEVLDFEQMSATYEPTILEKECSDLEIYFEKHPENFISNFKLKFPQYNLEINEEENKDWMEEWKKDFKAFFLAGEYWVVPSWLEVPAEAKKHILIDPGMAFGTGTHETTKLASEIICDHMDSWKESIGSCIDVGTGTGILAFLVNREITAEVYATEIDPVARVVARENALKNNCNINIPDYQIEDFEQSFDLVIANIIDGVLLNIKPHLIKACNPNSYMILTGILQERDENFITKFMEESEMEIIERRSKNEWIGYLLKKK